MALDLKGDPKILELGKNAYYEISNGEEILFSEGVEPSERKLPVIMTSYSFQKPELLLSEIYHNAQKIQDSLLSLLNLENDVENTVRKNNFRDLAQDTTATKIEKTIPQLQNPRPYLRQTDITLNQFDPALFKRNNSSSWSYLPRNIFLRIVEKNTVTKILLNGTRAHEQINSIRLFSGISFQFPKFPLSFSEESVDINPTISFDNADDPFTFPGGLKYLLKDPNRITPMSIIRNDEPDLRMNLVTAGVESMAYLVETLKGDDFALLEVLGSALLNIYNNIKDHFPAIPAQKGDHLPIRDPSKPWTMD